MTYGNHLKYDLTIEYYIYQQPTLPPHKIINVISDLDIRFPKKNLHNYWASGL
jgi:hypothetical protein